MSNSRVELLDSSEEDFADLSDSQDSEDDIEMIEVPKKCDPVVGVGYSIPLVNATSGTAKVALGMASNGSSIPATVSVSGISFAVSLGINLQYTMRGIRFTVNYIRYRTLPRDWPEISTAKNVIAGSLALTTSLTKSGTSGLLNHFYVMRLPDKFAFADKINMSGWQAFSWTMSGFTFVGSLSSGGMQMYSKLRYMCGGKRSDYSSRFSRFVSPVIGTTLSMAYATSSYSGGVVSVAHTFGIVSPGPLAGVCVLSTVNTLNNQFTNVPHNVGAVDKFLACFVSANGKTPAYRNPYQVVSFAIALGAGGLMAWANWPVNTFLMKETLLLMGANNTEVTDPIVEVVAGTSVLSNLVWVGSALTPMLYAGMQYVVKAFSSCCGDHGKRDKMREVECLLVESEVDMGDIDVKTPLQGNSIFSRPRGTGRQDAIENDDFYERTENNIF